METSVKPTGTIVTPEAQLTVTLEEPQSVIKVVKEVVETNDGVEDDEIDVGEVKYAVDDGDVEDGVDDGIEDGVEGGVDDGVQQK